MSVGSFLGHSAVDCKLQAKWDSLVSEIIDHWKNGKGDLQSDELFSRTDLVNRVRDACLESEFLNVMLGICKNNVDEMLYLLQHFCRMMSAFPRLCELLYIHGPKKAGKDVLCSMLQTFFGDVGDNGFGASLPNDYFAVKPGGGRNKRGSEESHPMLHSIKNARVVIIPEAPEGKTDMTTLKPLCEQLGAKIATRTHNKDPERSHPSYEFVFFSNHNMDIGDSPDSGEARRVNVVRLCNRFGSDPNDDAAEKADLKERIIDGCMVHEMFHYTKTLYPALNLYTTNIRRPARIEQETLEVTGGVLHALEVHEWVLQTFEKSDVANCSTEGEVKKMCQEKFGIGKLKDVRNKMIEVGFKLDERANAKRFCTYRFDDDGLKPVKVR
jgi:hypothetical protein